MPMGKPTKTVTIGRDARNGRFVPHMTTPLKTVMLALTVADLDILTALFYVGKRRHTDPGWVELRAQAFSAAGQPEEKGND